MIARVVKVDILGWNHSTEDGAANGWFGCNDSLLGNNDLFGAPGSHFPEEIGGSAYSVYLCVPC